MSTYILLGILQGIFEWIPISSEGVVALVSQFLLMELNVIDLALFLHLGTLLAVVFYFRKDWENVIKLKDSQLVQFLLISALVSLIAGYPMYQIVRSTTMGGGLLLIMGFGLLLTACFHKIKKVRKIPNHQLAIITGFLQGLAVIPGLSRSGATIFGLSLSEIQPAQALKISYMMSAPVVLASGAYLYLNNPFLFFSAWPALIFSFLAGILTLHCLIKWSQKIDFFKFALIFAGFCFLGAIVECLI